MQHMIRDKKKPTTSDEIVALADALELSRRQGPFWEATGVLESRETLMHGHLVASRCLSEALAVFERRVAFPVMPYQLSIRFAPGTECNKKCLAITKRA
ncbi:hypothetical protein G5I_03092 [Acromyrmex echinatior]|uniref:Uncharacterized protein n=1 Tax=Acromyrmex echinatior TaxID=103372 RepID=F4WC20_ACREC|nr:hypothetical protein G5I_03092 [Acromyrmex echinatior]